MNTRLSSCYTKSSVQYWAQIEQVIWTNISFNFAISMSGYIDLTSQQNNGTKSNSRQKHQLFCKIFFYREGQEKAFYHNVRILYKAKQGPGEKEREVVKKRQCKVFYMMQWSYMVVLQLYYDAMKQYKCNTMQWSKSKQRIHLYYNAIEQYNYITMQWSNTNILRCNEATQQVEGLFTYSYCRHSSWHRNRLFHILRQSGF